MVLLDESRLKVLLAGSHLDDVEEARADRSEFLFGPIHCTSCKIIHEAFQNMLTFGLLIVP